MTTLGIIANPCAGSDVRRLTSPAPFCTEAARAAALACVVAGAVEAGVTDVAFMADRRGVTARAVASAGLDGHPVDIACTGTRLDSQRSAAAMQEIGVRAVVVLGGDGTHRDVIIGWRDAPIVALSTGTNNVFPARWDPTIAGFAAGLVATGVAPLAAVAHQALVAHAAGSCALVDLALVDGEFTGSRAILGADGIRELVLPIAEPGRIGLSAIGGIIRPSPRDEDSATHVRLAPFPHARTWVRAPLMPGRFDDVGIEVDRSLALDEPVELQGPGVLAFDGERDRVLGRGETVTVRVRRDGPWVIDPTAVLATVAQKRDEVRCAV